MGLNPRGRMLAIIGSGETSPTMVTVHRDLAGTVAAALREWVLARDGLTVLASAAAVTAGQFALRAPAGGHGARTSG